MRPRLLDLFCGAGGAAAGYHRAGFDVVGVDIRPQPRYPFEFVCGDACSEWLDILGPFDAIHASPPCQAWTPYRRRGAGIGDAAPNMIAEVRAILEDSGLPYVIENVGGAPLRETVQLCGTGFGLDVQRHRMFECSFPVMAVPCAHGRNGPRFQQATNRRNQRRTVEVGVWRIPLDVQQRAMGIDWMTLEELSNAVPPAYTEHIGGYLMAEVRARAVA